MDGSPCDGLQNLDLDISRRPSMPRSLVAVSAIAAFLALAFVAFTWPLALYPTTLHFLFIPARSDVYLFMWNLWWVKEALLQGRNPLYTDILYYPTGISLAFHTLSLPQGLLALPWTLTGNYLLGYNFTAFVSYMVTGLLVAWLCRILTGSWAAGAFAGIYFVLAPPYMYHWTSAHLNLVSLQWPLGAAITCVKLADAHGTARRVMLIAVLAVCAAAAAYSDLQQALFLTLIMPVIYVTHRSLRLPERALSVSYAAAGFVSAILLLPLLIPLIHNFATVVSSSPDYVASTRNLINYSVDLVSFIYPTAYTVDGLLLYHTLLRLPNLVEAPPAFLGYAAIPFMIFGALRRRNWPLVLLAGLAVVLAIGPHVKVAGQVVSQNPVAHLAWATPILKISRTPERFMLVGSLSLALLAGSGLSAMLSRLRLAGRLSRRPAIYVLLAVVPAAITALELLPTAHAVPLSPSPSPELVRPTAQGGPGTLLEIPRNHGTIAMLRMEYHQIAHGQPLITGYVSRPQFPNLDRSERLEPQLALSTLRYLGNYEETELWHEDPWGAATPKGIDVRQRVRDVLGWFNIRYVLVDKTVMNQNGLAQMRRRLDWVLEEHPSAEDDNFILYTVDPPPKELLIDFGELWHAWEHNGQSPFRWSSGRSSLFVLSSRPQRVAVRFQAWSFGGPRRLKVTLEDQPVDTVPIGEQPGSVVLQLQVNRGLNQIILEASGQPLPERSGGRNLSFAITDPTVEPTQ